MRSRLLPSKLDFGEQSFEEQKQKAYKYFLKEILPYDKREKFRGENVFIDANRKIRGKNEMFLHLAGLNETEKFTVFPCTNTRLQVQCFNLDDCYNGKKTGNNRLLCLYRMDKLPWFNEVIKLANENSKFVTVFEYVNKGEKKIKIRYQERNELGQVDYIIILKPLRIGYKLITAFPVVHTDTKKRYDKQMEKYLKK